MHKHGHARWRVPVAPLAIAVICFAGVVVALFPSAASWLSEYEQSSLIDDLTAGTETEGSAERAAQLFGARQYNEQLFGNALVGANERLPQADSTQVASDYSEQLAADTNGLMARIKVAAIDVDLPIYHGTSDSILDKGIGHLEARRCRSAGSAPTLC